jgi:hypothetical protein
MTRLFRSIAHALHLDAPKQTATGYRFSRGVGPHPAPKRR